jgi:hypothetical protein
VFIGLSLFNVNNTAWSWQLTIWIFVIVNLTRVIVIIPSYYLLTLCTSRDFSFKEIMFICLTGNIKGAICFGLLVEMSEFGVWCNLTTANCLDHTYYPEDSCINQSVISNAILVNVIFSTLLYGSFMGAFRRCLVGDTHEKKLDAIKTAS